MGRVREGSRELRDQRGVKESEGEGREQRGAKGSKGSESISILGFKVPTICGGKNFDEHI